MVYKNQNKKNQQKVYQQLPQLIQNPASFVFSFPHFEQNMKVVTPT